MSYTRPAPLVVHNMTLAPHLKEVDPEETDMLYLARSWQMSSNPADSYLACTEIRDNTHFYLTLWLRRCGVGFWADDSVGGSVSWNYFYSPVWCCQTPCCCGSIHFSSWDKTTVLDHFYSFTNSMTPLLKRGMLTLASWDLSACFCT